MLLQISKLEGNHHLGFVQIGEANNIALLQSLPGRALRPDAAEQFVRTGLRTPGAAHSVFFPVLLHGNNVHVVVNRLDFHKSNPFLVPLDTFI